MKARITVLGGDGIGPEVTGQAVRVLQAVAKKFSHEFEFTPALIGGAAIDATGSALPPATVDACRGGAAVLLGAVGGPKWSDPAAKVRPEQGLLELRKAGFDRYVGSVAADAFSEDSDKLVASLDATLPTGYVASRISRPAICVLSRSNRPTKNGASTSS